MNRVPAIALLLILALGVGLLPAHAQLSTNSAQDPITIELNPQYPEPYSIAEVRPSSTLVDLSASTVTVSVNGSVVGSGTGKQSYQVPIGGPGSVTVISVTVNNAGTKYQKKLNVHPGDVALVVESLATTHPLYGGAPLVGAQSQVRLIALADIESAPGKPIPASQLEYIWKFGDQVLEAQSGLGKAVLRATAPVRYRDADITVTVMTPDQSFVAEAKTNIEPIDPYVRIYANDPLLGPLFTRALPTELSMSDSEDTFRVVPYYFSGIPTIAWTVNDTPSGADQDITVRAGGSGQGTAILGVTVNRKDAQQEADTRTTIHFGAKKSLGIFGL